VLEVRYVGRKGTFLDTSLLNYNSPPPGPGPIQPRRPFPALGEIRMWSSNGNSNYNAMQVQYEHRFARGLSAKRSKRDRRAAAKICSPAYPLFSADQRQLAEGEMPLP